MEYTTLITLTTLHCVKRAINKTLSPSYIHVLHWWCRRLSIKNEIKGNIEGGGSIFNIWTSRLKIL